MTNSTMNFSCWICVNSTKNSQDYLTVLNKILFDNTYDIAIRPVKTLNTTSYSNSTILRVKNVNSDFSDDFKDAISDTDKPVVMSRGLWSNLLTWEDFGKELAGDGRDTWLIEITGGPTQDSADSPNYNYSDLVDYYWSILIAGVQNYSWQTSLDYVGFSNGCRTALDSLKNWSSGKNDAGYVFDYNTGQYVLADLSSDPVDTFVGVGCPGAFEGTSSTKTLLTLFGDKAISNLENQGKEHITLLDSVQAIQDIMYFPNKGSKISRNLFEQYVDWTSSSEDSQPGKGLSFNKFAIIEGDITGTSDMVVTVDDQSAIYYNISANNKKYLSTKSSHKYIADKYITKRLIRKTINNEDFNWIDNFFVLDSQP